MASGSNDLAQVVAARLAALGRPLGEVAARCDPPLPAPYVSQVATGRITRPTRERLAALAVGLETDVAGLLAAMHRPPRPASAADVALPPAVLAAFHRAQTSLSVEELDALYAHLGALTDLVSRAAAVRAMGSTNYPDDQTPKG